MPPGDELYPYRYDPEAMRSALTDPLVNASEHAHFFPRLLTLLPAPEPLVLPFRRYGVRSILDYGCGPGNFTAELAALYPRAQVLGVDAVEEILPKEPPPKRLSFRVWDGTEPLDEDPFDVIVAKMVLQYIPPDLLPKVMKNLNSVLSDKGSLVVSVPHSADSRRFAPEVKQHSMERITREIGNTGIVGSMWHYEHWLSSVLHLMPEEFVAILDEVKSPEGELKRSNFLFCPRGERAVAAFRNLNRLGLSRDSPEISAEITEMLSDELRSVENASRAQDNE